LKIKNYKLEITSMGHKVHPTIFRMQVIYTWDSRWFGKKNYKKLIEQDLLIREFLQKKFKEAQIDAISVERTPKALAITILAAKPGFIIGRGGQALDGLRKEIERKFLQMSTRVKLNIREVRSPGLSAQVIAQGMVGEIERRIPFRRVMKQMLEKVMANRDVLGVRIFLAGRLGGATMSRTEDRKLGRIPLQTLRADVDYALAKAVMSYGTIGVKVWIYKGDIFK